MASLATLMLVLLEVIADYVTTVVAGYTAVYLGALQLQAESQEKHFRTVL